MRALRFLLAFVGLLFADSCYAQFVPPGVPWVVYGQTSVTSGGVTNPTPNVNGVTGASGIEVSSLPYTVPTGHVLYITAASMESYNQTGIAELLPWIGTTFSVTSQSLMPSTSSGGTRVVTMLFAVPAGTKVNVNLANTQSGGTQVFGWALFGVLD
jgi:hypothetical protein